MSCVQHFSIGRQLLNRVVAEQPFVGLLMSAPRCLCRRRDVYERAELSRGTYEIVATKEYMVRAPQPVIHVFCIDVSQPAIASGATAATCQCIEQVLDSLQGARAVWCWLLWLCKQAAQAPVHVKLSSLYLWQLYALCVSVCPPAACVCCL
jgi:hypothetical protein